MGDSMHNYRAVIRKAFAVGKGMDDMAFLLHM